MMEELFCELTRQVFQYGIFACVAFCGIYLGYIARNYRNIVDDEYKCKCTILHIGMGVQFFNFIFLAYGGLNVLNAFGVITTYTALLSLCSTATQGKYKKGLFISSIFVAILCIVLMIIEMFIDNVFDEQELLFIGILGGLFGILGALWSLSELRYIHKKDEKKEKR